MSTVPETDLPLAGSATDDESGAHPFLAFAPLHKRALGVALGLVGGLAVFAVTAFHLIALGGSPDPIRLLSQYFSGYEVSWPGAFIGFFWGFVSLFVFGWFAAFLRNLVLATFVFIARTREELRQTRDFLDHI
jgi:hypothetical protein